MNHLNFALLHEFLRKLIEKLRKMTIKLKKQKEILFELTFIYTTYKSFVWACWHNEHNNVFAAINGWKFEKFLSCFIVSQSMWNVYKQINKKQENKWTPWNSFFPILDWWFSSKWDMRYLADIIINSMHR